MFLLDVLQLCAIALVTTLLLYFIGSVFINIISNKNIRTPRNLFFSIFWGAIIIVSTVAIIITRGSTIFLLTIIPVLIIIKHKIEIEEITWGKLFWQMLGVIFIFGAVTLFLLFFPYSSNVEYDMPFYAKISQYLFTLGKENGFHYFNEVMIDKPGNTPYHYFELYFNGLISWLLSPHFTHLFLFKFFTTPLFITYVIIGLQNFILKAHNKLSGFFSTLFIILSLFISLDPIANLIFPSWTFSHFIFTRSIFIFYYLIITAAFLSFYKTQNYYILTAIILLLPIISATTAPAIYSGAILFYIYLLITKNITRNSFFKLSGLVIFSAGFYLLFYLFTGSSTKGAVPTIEFQTLINKIFTLWKAIIHQIVTLSIKSMLFALWPILILFIIRKKESFNVYSLVIFSLLTTFAGITVYQLIHYFDNSYQAPYIGYVSIATFFVISLILLYNYTNIYLRTFFLLAAGIFAIMSNIHRKSEVDSKYHITYNYLIQKGYQMDDIINMENLLDNNQKKPINAGFIFKETTHMKNLIKPLVYQLNNHFFILKDEFNLYPLTPLEKIKTRQENDLNVISRIEKSKDQLIEQLPFYNNYTHQNDIDYINNHILNNNFSFVITEEPIIGLKVPTIIIPDVN